MARAEQRWQAIGQPVADRIGDDIRDARRAIDRLEAEHLTQRLDDLQQRAAERTQLRRGSGAPVVRRMSRQLESWDPLEHVVGGDECDTDVHGAGGDPEIVGVDRIGERMSRSAAAEAKACDFGQQIVGHGDPGRAPDGGLQTAMAFTTPSAQ